MTNTIDPISYNAGIEAAKKAVAKRRDDYVAEHGNYDPSTGVTEFPGNGDEYVGELDEIEELIGGLHRTEPQTAPEPYTPPQVGEPCDAEGVKSIPDAVSLLRQWAKALRANKEHTVETIAIVNGICVADDLDGVAAFLVGVAASADAERLALAAKLRVAAKIAGNPVHDDIMRAAEYLEKLRAGGWREDMAAFGMRAYALCGPDGKHWRVVVGFQSLSDAQSALTAVANFPSAPHTDKEG